ncbi:HWE histidine kinase domain-containing protein [Methylocapsa sp. S129]|uniref:HWE histidine kinase domain-containing protein n=1 Tax=Methylocapsa sp. S129 TaxID=1641869 RepID=UPI00131E4C9C|nr:HWE histidine kinase domain-containing protein [Methylocapsa sp. S129]
MKNAQPTIGIRLHRPLSCVSMDEDLGAPYTESERLAALARYGVLDTEPEPGFDDIVLLATRICETPVALVSLVAESRQWFKARIGFPPCETPLGQSVCAHALRQKGVLMIPDLTLDARTWANTLVTGEPFIRFYAGALLETPDGVPLGTLCVIDTKPRPEGLTPAQTDSLQALARQVMGQMELRRIKQHQEMLKNEMSHRLKNILTMVQAVISQTFRNARNIEDARETLSNRILALGRAQEILFAGSTESAGLASIIQSAAQLHGDEGERRFHIRGPAIEVAPKAALALTLMMHELATNAAKYGALSTSNGNVAVGWKVTAAGQEQQLSLLWRESGGPAVAPPKHQGFGTRLIEQALASQVRGVVALDYLSTGLECRLDAPLSGLSDIL